MKSCARSLFIFDEVDDMDPGIIDAIKPFLGNNNFFLNQGLQFLALCTKSDSDRVGKIMADLGWQSESAIRPIFLNILDPDSELRIRIVNIYDFWSSYQNNFFNVSDKWNKFHAPIPLLVLL